MKTQHSLNRDKISARSSSNTHALWYLMPGNLEESSPSINESTCDILQEIRVCKF